MFAHVRGCVCLTLDRLRCACVASNSRVYLWIGWLGLLTVGRGGWLTNWTRGLCLADKSRLGADPHGAGRTARQWQKRQIPFSCSVGASGPKRNLSTKHKLFVWFVGLRPPCPALATQATSRHANSRQHKHSEHDQK